MSHSCWVGAKLGRREGSGIAESKFKEWEEQWEGRERFEELKVKGKKRRTPEDNKEFEVLGSERTRERHVLSQEAYRLADQKELAKLRQKRADLF